MAAEHGLSPGPAPRYWAFLSYSHADRSHAAWLHRALETYAIPRRLVGRPSPAGPIPRRLRPVFRDREELGAVADLGERLRTALDESAFLIVICSPAAARSAWVDEEVRQFLKTHGTERVLILTVGGRPEAPGDHPETCFPPALRPSGAEPGPGLRHERLAADLRAGGDGRRRALLKLVAGMLAVDLHDLVRRDLQQRNRQLAALAAMSLAATAVMGALSLVAVTERDRAVAERKQAEGLIAFMIGDLSKRLEPTGQLDILDAIGKRALAYYAAENPGPQDTDALAGRARVLQAQGEVQEDRGDLAEAGNSFDAAAAITAELLRKAPNTPERVLDHAHSEFYLGELAVSRGDDDAALARLENYEILAQRLVRLSPDTPAYLAEAEEAEEGVGAALLREGKVDAALARFMSALPISRDLVARAPSNRDRAWDLAQLYAWLADCQVARGKFGEALADRGIEAEIYKRLIRQKASDMESAAALWSSNVQTARVEIHEGDVAAGVADLKTALHELDGLLAAAPDNVTYMKIAAPGLILMSEALLRTGQLDDASFDVRRAIDISQIDGSRLDLAAAKTLSIRIAAAQAPTAAAQRSALAPAPVEAARLKRLIGSARKPGELSFYVAEASLLAGDRSSLTGDSQRALSTWRDGASTLASFQSGPAGNREATGALLQQFNIRLSSGHPPTRRPSQSDAPGAGPAKTEVGELIDYRW